MYISDMMQTNTQTEIDTDHVRQDHFFSAILFCVLHTSRHVPLSAIAYIHG